VNAFVIYGYEAYGSFLLDVPAPYWITVVEPEIERGLTDKEALIANACNGERVEPFWPVSVDLSGDMGATVIIASREPTYFSFKALLTWVL
jgi:hypothetical protein